MPDLVESLEYKFLAPGETLLDHVIDDDPELDWKVMHDPDSEHFNNCYLRAKITLPSQGVTFVSVTLKNVEKVSDFRVSTHSREYDSDDAEDENLIERNIVYNRPNIY